MKSNTYNLNLCIALQHATYTLEIAHLQKKNQTTFRKFARIWQLSQMIISQNCNAQNNFSHLSFDTHAIFEYVTRPYCKLRTYLWHENVYRKILTTQWIWPAFRARNKSFFFHRSIPLPSAKLSTLAKLFEAFFLLAFALSPTGLILRFRRKRHLLYAFLFRVFGSKKKRGD